jgi:hypothetical protein
MKFEDALSAMREGAKIRHPSWDEDEYLMGCYVGFIFPEESFKEKKKRSMSIVKMKGKNDHPDMVPHPELYELSFDQYMGKVNQLMLEGKIPEPCSRPELHKYPQLNLLLIMFDDWEIVE